MSTTQPHNRIRSFLALWCVVIAGYALTGVAQLGNPGTPGDGGTQWPQQKCTASGSCAGTPVPGGVCPSGESPCCCKIAPSAVYVCACRSSDSCLHPGAGNHCDESSSQ